MLRITDTFSKYHRVPNLIYQKTSNYLIMKRCLQKEYTQKQMFDNHETVQKSSNSCNSISVY